MDANGKQTEIESFYEWATNRWTAYAMNTEHGGIYFEVNHRGEIRVRQGEHVQYLGGSFLEAREEYRKIGGKLS